MLGAMALAKRMTIFIAAFVVAFGAALAVGERAGLFAVRAIPVEVASSGGRLDARSEARLRERVGDRLKPFIGRKVWDVDLGALRAAILGDEWVRDARVSRAFPSDVRVIVSAKQPELLFLGSDGRLRPIADDGSLLAPISPTILPDVPIVRGASFADSLELRRKAVDFARALPERGALGKRNIAEIVYAPDDGYALALANPKTEVRLGDERLPLKIARASQVLEYLDANKLKGKMIDASFSKKVLVRLRKGP